MMLEKVIYLLAIVVSYFIQTSVDFFRLGDIKPDFILLLTVYFAMYRGPFAGLWVGFLGGLLQDVNLGGVADPATGMAHYYIGTHALSKTLVGYLTGKMSKEINKDSMVVLFSLILAVSLVNGILTFFNVAVFHNSVAAQSIITIIIPEMIYNSILSLVWFKLLKWLLPQIEPRQAY